MSDEPRPAAISFPDGLGVVVEGLKQARRDWRESHPQHVERGSAFPSRQALKRIVRELSAALFPLRFSLPEVTAANENAWVEATLETALSQLAAHVALELNATRAEIDSKTEGEAAERIVGAFAASLPDIRRLLDADVKAGYANDPAAKSVDEVLISHPSLTAIIQYRLAHRLHALGATLVARMIAEDAH